MAPCVYNNIWKATLVRGYNRNRARWLETRRSRLNLVSTWREFGRTGRIIDEQSTWQYKKLDGNEPATTAYRKDRGGTVIKETRVVFLANHCTTDPRISLFWLSHGASYKFPMVLPYLFSGQCMALTLHCYITP